MFIDSHCHLDDFRYVAELDDVINNAIKNDVKIFLSAGTKISELPNLQMISDKYPNVFYSVGIHPQHATEENATLEEIIKLSEAPKVLGIGEVGLDYYWDKNFKEEQKQVFLTHIKAAQITGLPIIIHTRDADEDMITILESEHKKSPLTGVIHCFSSGENFAKRALALGFYISVSGSITFKNCHKLKEIIKTIPNDKLLIETDCPYLTPEPFRGKMNYPAYVIHTAKVLAEIKGDLTTEEIGEITSNNFKRLYHKKLKENNICL